MANACASVGRAQVDTHNEARRRTRARLGSDMLRHSRVAQSLWREPVTCSYEMKRRSKEKESLRVCMYYEIRAVYLCRTAFASQPHRSRTSPKTLSTVYAITIRSTSARRFLYERAIFASVYRARGRSIARCSPWRLSLLPPTLVSSPFSTSYTSRLLSVVCRDNP